MARIDRLIAERAAWCRNRGFVAVCCCHSERLGFTADEWAALPNAHTWHGIEYRDCPCGSTIGHALQAEEDNDCPPTVRNDR
jgi:hypothetical protein